MNENVMLEKRSINIDAIKGWACILVVVGHAIYVTYTKPDSVFIFELIYSFHMPLFMFISGYVTYKRNRDIDMTWIKRRFVSLVVPFCVWIIMPFTIKGEWNLNNILSQVIDVMKRPDNGLWFLWILFLNCFLLFVGMMIQRKIKSDKDWIILPGLVLALNVINILIKAGNGWLGLGMFAWYSVFYVTGYLVAEYKEKCNTKLRWMMILLCSILYVLFVPMWRRTELPIFLQQYAEVWYGGIIVIISKSFNYLVGFCGIALSALLVRYLPWICKSVLARLGKYTLEIYVLHMYMFPIVNFDNQYINMICKVFVGIGGSLLWMWVIRTGMLNVLMFGKQNK